MIVNGTNGDDVITIANAMVWCGVGPRRGRDIRGFDANDRIVINGLGGDDVVDASGLQPGIQLRPTAATATTC